MKAKVIKAGGELFVNTGGVLIFSYNGKGKEGDIVDVELIDVPSEKGGFRWIAVEKGLHCIS